MKTLIEKSFGPVCRSNPRDYENCFESKKLLKRIARPNLLSQSLISTILFVLSLLLFTASANESTNDGICQSKDIRGRPSELNALRNCRVIEGFLMITLIEQHNDTDYDELTFPDLVEITDFLLLYRVEGLKTLSHLFPNLRVIRGNNLIDNYALIIYEMFQLTEIGLRSLTTIVRGSVRIEKNAALCFVDTINWLYIANGTHMEDHFIDANKESNECGVCPTGKMSDGSDNSGGDVECPISKNDASKSYCWNRQFCQKICPDSCGTRSCDDKGNCCHESCLGSCDSSNSANCTVCRKLSLGYRECVNKCPDHLFMYEQRRCISDRVCWNISKPFLSPGDNTDTNPFIPFNGTCTATCPKYFSPDGPNGGRYCKSCNGECKRECRGGTIDSISTARDYRGCAIIMGTLLIQIRHENVITELEESLSDIEEIEGALKVIRSYPLISLSFFKKLKVIHGRRNQENYALYVIDNQNLESLFGHEVKIEQGKIFFHFNSKLCYKTIEDIKKDVYDLSGVAKFDIEDVAVNSNGDKVACNLEKLTASPSSVIHIGAVIDVHAIKYDDSRVLLGYVLHFKPAPHRNVSLFSDAHGWQVKDVTNFDRNAPIVQIILTGLKPYTQYAYYIKTYTIASETFGGLSDILYFRTAPWQPDRVQKMKLIANGSSSIIVTWEPPKAANGELTNYIVKASLIYDDPELLRQRNFCEEPLRRTEEKTFEQPPAQHKPLTNTPNECVCPEDDEYSAESGRKEVEQIVDFENKIQNIVYLKRTLVVTSDEQNQWLRRTIDTPGKYSIQANTNEEVYPARQRMGDSGKSPNDFVESKMESGYYVQFYNNRTNASTHTFTLDNLRHFTMYSISVQACRDFNDSSFNVNTYCSNVVQLNRRTAKNNDADKIDYLLYKKVTNSNTSLSMVKLNWAEPKNPNGLILSYTIIYKRVDLDNVKPTEQCVTSQMHTSLGEEIPLLQLSNGNYSVSVRTTSLAGDGPLTRHITIVIDESRFHTATVGFIVLGVVLLLAIATYTVCLYRRRKARSPVPRKDDQVLFDRLYQK